MRQFPSSTIGMRRERKRKVRIGSFRVDFRGVQITNELNRRDENIIVMGSFYENISHIFKLSSIIGLNLSVPSYPSETTSRSENELSGGHLSPSGWRLAKVFSFTSLSNIFFLVAYIYMTIWICQHLGGHLGQFFKGVDYYALAVDVILNFVQVTCLLLHARLRGRVLVALLNQTQAVHLSFQEHMQDFYLPKGIKYLSVFLLVLTLSSSLLYGSIFLYLIFGLSPSYNLANQGLNVFTFSYVIQKLGHFCIPFYFQTFVALFILITETVRHFYLHLAQKLSSILSQDSVYENFPATPATEQSSSRLKLANKIKQFRLTYEKLRNVVESISQYFGVCLLTVCSISVVSITSAIYTIILNRTEDGSMATQDIESYQEEENQRHRCIVSYFFLLWGFHLYFAIVNLGAVLLCGQRVTDASNTVAKRIQESSLTELDHDTQFQINLMLKSIYQVPVEITACSITKMSMSFFASAVGNVITYILVLLQFRSSLCVEKIKV